MEWDTAARSAGENYHFLCSAVAPRPIAWVSTMADGVVNVAPFSWFNAAGSDPPMLSLAISNRDSGAMKDTARNIRATHEFVVNIVPAAAAAAMVATSADYPPGVSEPGALGLAMRPSARVAPPRIAASPVSLECRLERVLELGRGPVHLVIGEIVHVAAEDAVLDARGNVDPERLEFLARMGGATYAVTRERLQLKRPPSPASPT